MEAQPEPPEPDLRVHFFSTAIVSELIKQLTATEHDDFIEGLDSPLKREAD